MRTVVWASLVLGVVTLSGCVSPVEVWPPSWHPAHAGEVEAGGAEVESWVWEGGALAEAEPVAPAGEGVVPPNAGGAEGEKHGHEHHGHGAGGDAATGAPMGEVYTCPMHPHVISETPGTCPECGMMLEEHREGGEE